MYWSSSWARILNVQNIIKERTKETSSSLSSTCIPSTTIAGAGQHLFNTRLQYTSYRGCGPTHQIPVQCGSIVYDAGPTLIHHWVSCILCPKTLHSINVVSMLTHSLRCWPVIETALGDCTVFADCCIMLVTLLIPEPEIPDNTIHWLNADVMLCHRLRRWANIFLVKTL